MVPEILEGLRFLRSGATSNLWGLGCPLYCTQPTVGFLLASFLTGIISGFGLGIWIAYLVLTRVYNLEPQLRTEHEAPRAPNQRGRLRLEGYRA